MSNQKSSMVDKEKKLLDRIEQDKKRLAELKQKKIIELGKIMIKYGFDKVEPVKLEEMLKNLSHEMNEVHA